MDKNDKNKNDTINENLQKFFDKKELSLFKDFLYNNKCFIAGSFVTEQDPSDIDIYITHMKQEKNPIIDLLESFGYKERYHIHASYYTENILFIKTFEKKVEFYEYGCKSYKIYKIQIMSCLDPLWVISNFDFTCCINSFNGKDTFYYHPENYNGTCKNKICFFNKNIKYTDLQMKTHNYRQKKYTKRGYTIIDKDINPTEIYNNMKRIIGPQDHIIDIPQYENDKLPPPYTTYTTCNTSLTKRRRRIKCLLLTPILLIVLSLTLALGYIFVLPKVGYIFD